jgi:hypothetical protein
MEWVAGFRGKVKWPLAVVVALIALTIIFHWQINRIPIPRLLVKEAVRRLGNAEGLGPDLVQLVEVASSSANACSKLSVNWAEATFS